jgi:hypothetical protein
MTAGSSIHAGLIIVQRRGDAAEISLVDINAHLTALA